MKRKRWIRALVWTASIAAALLALAFSAYKIMDSRTFQFFGGIVNRITTPQKAVALTFDDGPSGKTDTVLGILKDADIKATFFLVGSSIEQYPAETLRIAQAGHEIGNHTYTHTRMVFRTLSTIADEIEKTDALIRAAGYTDAIQFRPPNGKKLLLLPYYLKQHGRKTILWDLEPNSYPDVDSNSDNIVKYVVDNAKPGSIILLHVMYDTKGHSIGAIKGIAKGLKEKGYTFVTINELLRYNNK
jgi:peptidoglycan-N-acetylglucosamine deacetylase